MKRQREIKPPQSSDEKIIRDGIKLAFMIAGLNPSEALSPVKLALLQGVAHSIIDAAVESLPQG